MSPCETSVLLGAGFSVPFDVPTMRPFYEDFVQFARVRYPRLKTTLSAITEELDENADLETLLGRLNKACDARESLPPAPPPRPGSG